jgi:hypothetical protein
MHTPYERVIRTEAQWLQNVSLDLRIGYIDAAHRAYLRISEQTATLCQHLNDFYNREQMCLQRGTS